MKTLSNNYSIIKNALSKKYSSAYLNNSKKTRNFLDVLYREGVIRGYNLYSKKRKIEIYLKYYKNFSVITDIKTISTSSRNIYFTFDDICYWDKISHHCFLVVSTSKGMKSSKEIKKLKIGGTVLCLIN